MVTRSLRKWRIFLARWFWLAQLGGIPITVTGEKVPDRIKSFTPSAFLPRPKLCSTSESEACRPGSTFD